MSESVTKTAVGQCVEISERNGWVAFSVDVGTKYPVKLSTKQEKIIEGARAVGSEVATWTYKEQESEKINENTGKPFINRYLDKVEIGAGAPQASPAGGSPLPEPHYDPIAPSDKDRAISRMSCLSSAAALLQGVEFEGEGQRIAAWLAAARAAEVHVYLDIDESPEVDGDDIPFN